MKHKPHPLFSGAPGLYNGIPEEAVRAIGDQMLRVLSSWAEAHIAAGLPIMRNGAPADPEKFGVIYIDAKRFS